MLFRTIEHYPYSEETNYFIEKECLICYNNISCDFIIKNKYNFNCECYKLLHENCLEMWYTKNNTCPICRKKHINKNNRITLFKIYKGVVAVITLIETVACIYVLCIFIIILVNIIIANLFH
jgi:hypothetical protein